MSIPPSVSTLINSIEVLLINNKQESYYDELIKFISIISTDALVLVNSFTNLQINIAEFLPVILIYI